MRDAYMGLDGATWLNAPELCIVNVYDTRGHTFLDEFIRPNRQLADESNLPGEFSMDEHMRCGGGVCRRA